MYVYPTKSGYDRDGQQFARRGLFLILLQEDIQWEDGKPVFPKETRAIVRKVSLHQVGHWMMGSARVRGHRIGLSGAYGADGLPKTVPPEVFSEGIPLPPELVEAWNCGGGHNGAGSEEPAMQEWARKNLATLYNVRARPGKGY